MSSIEKINKFWSWFEKNQHQYLFLDQVDQGEKERLLDEFLQNLHGYCSSLFFAIGGNPKNDKIDIIITAEGIIEHFDKVEQLVNNAPKLQDWNIIAFKQPGESGFKIDFGDREFDPDDIIFIPLVSREDPSAIGIHVCYPDYDEAERSVFMSATFLMLDSLIGEKATSLDIHYLDVIRTPDDIGNYDFMHLSNIGEYIREKKEDTA